MPNTDKKLTDSEIVKALEVCCTKRICKECIYLGNKVLCIAENTIAVLDLINRLQAENERLSTLAELGDMSANDYRAMRDRALKAEAKIERLKAKQEKCFYCTEQANKKISEIKAEAYKEFAEKSYIIIDMLLKRYGVKDFEEFKAICQILRSLKNSMNNLLKELVGEDDA